MKNVEQCIADIRIWMTQHLLRLNDNKTNNVYLASPHCVISLHIPALLMNSYLITPNWLVTKYGDYV